MTQRRKTFSFASDEPDSPIVIDLNGVDIRCQPSLDGLTLMEFTESVSRVSNLEGAEEAEETTAAAGIAAARSFLDLLRSVVEPEDWSLFEKTVKKQRVPLAGLAEITGWLVEQYSETPTTPS